MTDNNEERPERRRRTSIKGEQREGMRQLLAKEYDHVPWGAAKTPSIRDLAAAHEISYGLVRTLLLEAGVKLRRRTRRGKQVDQ